jgi:7-cyano-7-deazaguanine reductase
MPTTSKDLSNLTLLGHKARPSKKLEAFPNHNPDRRYTVTLATDEFTCLCPATGQPDFATITIKYIPDKKVVESKSLKLYLWSYRDEGVFHEHVVNTILDDLVKIIDPHWIEVTGAFKARGGIIITVVAAHEKKQKRKSSKRTR